jgi:hypothetical protein
LKHLHLALTYAVHPDAEQQAVARARMERILEDYDVVSRDPSADVGKRMLYEYARTMSAHLVPPPAEEEDTYEGDVSKEERQPKLNITLWKHEDLEAE